MNPRGFQIHFQGKRGLPAVLPLIAMAILAIGLIALFVFVGLTVGVVGLGLYACATLYYSVRRKLVGNHRPSGLHDQEQPSNSTPAGGKVIEIEAVQLDRDSLL